MASRVSFLHFGEVRWRVQLPRDGLPLRELLLEAGLSPYNSMAKAINCRGMGTCGTCAVHVSSSNAAVTPPTARERLRLSLPPFHGRTETGAGMASLRLACQCRLLPSNDAWVSKAGGLWGERPPIAHSDVQPAAIDIAPPPHSAGPAGAAPDVLVDTDSIRRAKPFPEWLRREMRSNHAGETGAVFIYVGALASLNMRRMLRSEQTVDLALRHFVEEHTLAERRHLQLLNEVLDRGWLAHDRSWLTSLWRVAGFSLGFLSTVFEPRLMFVTTDAVESFVETHYTEQLKRLGAEIPCKQGASAAAYIELQMLLRACCDDEVHHKADAQKMAALYPVGAPRLLQDAWRSLVQRGSAVGAGFAKRV